ncbi:VOC family protein [Marinomonas epiphytica]
MIHGFHHLVLTVASPEHSVTFYQKLFKLSPSERESNKGIQLAGVHIQFQTLGSEIRHHAMEGAGHFCLTTTEPLELFVQHMKTCEIPLLEGPSASQEQDVEYEFLLLNDCDNNLIEIRHYS